MPTDLSQALDQVARVTPLWDFTGSDWLSDDPNYWMGDTAHYSVDVGRMMLARIFGVPMPRNWERFGRLRGANGVVASEGRVCGDKLDMPPATKLDRDEQPPLARGPQA